MAADRAEDKGDPADISNELPSGGKALQDIVSEQLSGHDQSPETVARTIIAAVSESFIGPLPHPRHLKAYDDVVPGAARDILAMARDEQRHRHRIRSLEVAYPYLGWFAGFASFLICIAGAVYLGLHKQTAVALGLLGVPAAGAIGWFIQARIEPGAPD